MSRTRLVFSQGGLLLSLPVDEIERIQEADALVPLPGATPPVLGVAACGGRNRIILNLACLLPSGTTDAHATLTDQPPLWVIMEGQARGLALAITSSLSFSTPGKLAPRPAASATLCDRGERHPGGAAGLISSRRLLAAFRRAAGPLAAPGPAGMAER